MQEIKETLKAIQTDVTEIRVDISAIKVDVTHHIKRSDAADVRITRMENWVLGLASALVIAAIGWLLHR